MTTVKSLVFGKQDQDLYNWLMDNCRGNFSGHVLSLLYEAKENPQPQAVAIDDDALIKSLLSGLAIELDKSLRPLIAQEINKALRSLSLEQIAPNPQPVTLDDQDDLIAELTDNLLGAF